MRLHSYRGASIRNSRGPSCPGLRVRNVWFFNSGIDGVRTSLLITDKEVKTDAFADSLNSLLGSGEIPGLLDPESLGLLLADLQPAAEAARISLQPDSMLDFFLARVRENLRVLLCISPIGSKMRDYCRYDTSVWQTEQLYHATKFPTSRYQ